MRAGKFYRAFYAKAPSKTLCFCIPRRAKRAGKFGRAETSTRSEANILGNPGRHGNSQEILGSLTEQMQPRNRVTPPPSSAGRLAGRLRCLAEIPESLQIHFLEMFVPEMRPENPESETINLLEEFCSCNATTKSRK